MRDPARAEGEHAVAVCEERRSARGEGRGERLVSALDRRPPVSSAGKEFPRKSFPDHWSFPLGELALYSLLVLVLTGVWLTFFFHPDLTERPYGLAEAPGRGRAGRPRRGTRGGRGVRSEEVRR
ncbi:hypothetical protein [Streptomyces puniciscabiei]|uniref:hypothetical protein n=1 Tax=Streptomyces puniciscabiei TaxID=164348 RepID=UPI00379E182C